MSLRCSNCQADLKQENISAGGSVRCERCGVFVDTNFLGRVKRSVGIHPALAKRYGDFDVSDKSALPQVKTPTFKKDKHDVDTTSEEIIPVIPGYELLERIGKGAMGSVYHARHLSSGREAAVKVLSPELSSRQDLVARFEREAAALRSFRHPNVVAIFDSGAYGKTHYYSMEFVEGTTMRRCLKNGALPLDVSIRYMRAILLGLKAAHDRGIIHRDLKPENVLVEKMSETGEERVVLVDFGLAGIVNEAANPHPNLTRSRVTMGTVNYMAPEQHIDAKRVDFRSDLYACGVILYECIMGDLPLGRFALPTERGVRVPASVDACLAKALSRSLDDRYQSASDFDQALVQIEEELKTTTPDDWKVVEPEPQNVYYMPNVQNHTGTIHPTTIQPTQWMTVPPWVKKPTLAYGILALVVGLVIGVMVSRRTPQEVVVSADRASPVYARVSFKAPAPKYRKKSDGSQLADLAHSVAIKTISFQKWHSESPVWHYRDGYIAYLAKQGNAGHFRRDMSFLLAPIQVPTARATFAAKMTLERVRLPLDAVRAQHLARELLGGTPELAAGGVFYVNDDGDRAVGMVVFVDGSCGIAELQRQNEFLRFVQYVRGVCKPPIVGKEIDVGIQCDVATGQCGGFADGRKISGAHVDGMDSDEWKLATACRNINCLFEVR